MIRTRFLAVSMALAFLAACGSAPPPDAASAQSSASPATPDASAAPAPSSSVAFTQKADSAAAASSAPDPAPAPKPDPVPDSTNQPTNDKSPLTGKISKQTIWDLVSKNQDLFNDCYTIGAGKSKSFTATVTVKASVGPTGIVNATQVSKSTAKNPKVDQCVADAFKKIKFPATGSTVPITFPMEFNGLEQVK
jgi:hypothetical protein